MPRGKRLTLEEKLAKITEEIDNMKSSLAELESTKEELEEQIRMNKLSELDDMITESGLSYEKVKELLSKEQD